MRKEEKILVRYFKELESLKNKLINYSFNYNKKIAKSDILQKAEDFLEDLKNNILLENEYENDNTRILETGDIDFSLLINKHGEILSAALHTEQTEKLNAELFKQGTVFDYLDDKLEYVFREYLNQVFQSFNSSRFSHQIKFATAPNKVYQVTCIPYYNFEKDSTLCRCFFSNLLDINEKSKHSPSILKKFADITNEAILVANEKGKVIHVNKVYTNLTGYSKDDLIGMNFWIQVHRLSLFEKIELSGDNSNSYTPNGKETVLFGVKRKDGSVNCIHFQNRIIDIGGENYFILIIKSSNNKNVTFELPEQKIKYDRLLDHLPAIIYKISDKRGALYYSKKVEVILGYSVDELISNKTLWMDAIHPDDKEIVKAGFLEYFEGKPFNFEYRIKTNDGHWIWLMDTFFHKEKIKDETFIEGRAVNITERKNNLKLLKESEARFKNMFERHSSIMLLVDPATGQIIDSNEAATKFYGYSSEDFRKMSIDQINSASKLVLKEKMAEAIAENNNLFIFEHKLANGEKRMVEVHSSPVFYDDKNILFSIIHDVTDRVNSDNLLQKTHENYISFLNSIDVFLFVIDSAGNLLFVNETVRKRLNYSDEEILGKSVLFMHPSERRDEALEIIQRMIKGELDFCPIPLATKGGDRIAVETRVTKGIWDNKDVLFGISKDITKLVLSEEKFSKSFQMNSALMALSNLESGKFLDVNNAFLKTLGYSRKEVIGKTAKQLALFVSDKAREKLITILNYHDDFLDDFEIKVRTKDGRILYGLFSASILKIAGEKYLLTTMIDNSYRKESSLTIKLQNRELSNMNHEMNRFISILSHDLRSPFNSILGFLELLIINYDKYDQETAKKHLNRINSSAILTYNLLDDLLNWARIRSNTIQLTKEDASLAELIDSVIEIGSVSSIPKGISFNNLVDEAIIVSVDKDVITTVLRNLISNAIKFSHTGGIIIVRSEKIDGFIQVSVKDEGIGMTNEQATNLFKISKVFSTEGTKKEKGTGLGLLLCKELVNKAGGEIWVNSLAGRGTEIFFTIPEKK